MAVIASLSITGFSTGQTEDVATEAAPVEISSPALLLANVWNESIDPTGWWMSEEYDGVRGFWDGRKLWTRKGQQIAAPEFWLAELPREVALDGELWIGCGRLRRRRVWCFRNAG